MCPPDDDEYDEDVNFQVIGETDFADLCFR